MHAPDLCANFFFVIGSVPPCIEITCIMMQTGKSTSIHYAQVANFDIFTHNLCTSRIVYSWHKDSHRQSKSHRQ